MEQAAPEVLPIKQGVLLDILDQQPSPALSSTSDMPETKPDSTPAKVEKPAEPVKAEQSSESATDATEEDSGQQTEHRGVGKALAELRQQRKEAEARAKAAEENLRLVLEREKKPPEPVLDLVKPTRDAYSDPDAYDTAMLSYAEALAEKKVTAAVEKLRADDADKAKKAAEETTNRVRLDAYNSRVEKSRQAHADFDEVAQSPDVQVSMPVVHAIMTHDQGTEIQYYLGKNPAEAARIMALTVDSPDGPQPDVARQLMEVGLIVAKLNAPPVQAQPVAKAAPPIKPLKSAPSVEAKDPATMSMPEYTAWRKAQRH